MSNLFKDRVPATVRWCGTGSAYKLRRTQQLCPPVQQLSAATERTALAGITEEHVRITGESLSGLTREPRGIISDRRGFGRFQTLELPELTITLTEQMKSSFGPLDVGETKEQNMLGIVIGVFQEWQEPCKFQIGFSSRQDSQPTSTSPCLRGILLECRPPTAYDNLDD